jgi:hypothetical protein
MKFLKRVGSWCFNKVKKLTFHISRTATAVIMVLSALAGVNNLEQLSLAAYAFLIGIPLGFIIFGTAFSMLAWTCVVMGLLFTMNLHNAWEVFLSLRAGGLDYQMVAQAHSAVKAVTPTESDIETLNYKIHEINQNVRNMHSKHEGYEGNILIPLTDLPELT